MKLQRCSNCGKIKLTPVHVTEVNDKGEVVQLDLCATCGMKYVGEENMEAEETAPKPASVDLTHINTPQELLNFLADVRGTSPSQDGPPCECGMTPAEFDKHGLFGCPKCYEHFTDQMTKLVFPYHGAKAHVGKQPRHQMAERRANDPVEKEKVLKLLYAKALELENFEKAAEYKQQLNDLKKSSEPPQDQPPSSEGQ